MPETTQVFRFVIHGSVEDVWREITKTDEPIACFFNSRMEVSALRPAKQMVQGGPMIVNTLKAVIETGRPSLGTRALFALFRAMQPFTPKKCRTEHWPVAELPASKEPIHE